MPCALDRLRAEAASLLAATGLVSADSVALSEPRQAGVGDLAFPVFAVAKGAGVPPPEFAIRLAQACTASDTGLVASVDAAGGFVNITAHPGRFAAAVLEDVGSAGERYGDDPEVGAGRTVVVEYSSPNIARKMHVGHLRSTVIGHSIRRIHEALGYHVVADNHLGDWGTQFGMLLAAIDLWGATPWNDRDPVQSLVDLYARFNAAAKEDESLRDAARAWFRRLEDGDAWARETWQRLIDITMEEFDRTYARLGVSFDTVHGESFFEDMMPPLLEEALEKGIARREEAGAVVVDFDGALPLCQLLKSDGATLYQTRDAATCLYRLREYAPARNIYVVGAEQRLHFQQVFEIVRRLGYPEIADASVHISFGQVKPPDGRRFSMREGNVVFLNDVLDEAVDRAREKVDANIASGRYDLDPAEAQGIAEMLGVGAVIYFDLHQGPDRTIVFDWERMLSDEGNTATYIQYTHARCRSILRKAGEEAATHSDGGVLTGAEEQAVLKQLARMPHAVREAGAKYLPATIATWTYELARAFSRFYDGCPVLGAEDAAVRAARLALVAATAQGLRGGLALLGIGAPDRM